MPSPTSPNDDLAEIPGFARTSAPEEFQHPDQSLPESVDLSTTSNQPPPRSDAPKGPEKSSNGASSRESIDSITEEFAEELGNLGGGALEIMGVAMNKFMARRTKAQSTLWLATDDEIEAFGEAAARIADRKIPEQFKEGDSGDLIVMGSVLVSYAGRNLAGITRDDVERGAIPAQVVERPRPQPAPQAYPGPRRRPLPGPSPPSPQPPPSLMPPAPCSTNPRRPPRPLPK